MTHLRFQERNPVGSARSIEEPLLHASGFREYDARWIVDRDVNLAGLVCLGRAFGTLLRELDPGVRQVVLGHDYRSYSQPCAHAVGLGLVGAGLEVADIGLATTPMAYFAQFHLGIPALAQVTASHNENGWTGVKMGHGLARTLGPEEMDRLRCLALEGKVRERTGGGYRTVSGVKRAYVEDLLSGGRLKTPRKVVLATGHGTAGPVSEEVLEGVGCEVIPLHTDLDWTFPHGNPNPESESFLRALCEAVAEAGEALGLGLDGDGDRIGVVDEDARTLYADKVGLLLARWVAADVPDPRFVVDVKCTGLVADPQVLPGRVTWEKTGHSYIKRAVERENAHLGFERSGHFFFRPPYGRGYDDGLLSALLLLRMLDAGGRTLKDLANDLPVTYPSPNYQPHVDDARKYEVVEQIVRGFEALAATGGSLAGVPVIRVLTLNGGRAECADGSWLLVRASSNRPSLVVMAESRSGPERTRALIADAGRMLAGIPGVAPLDETTAG
ncbi:MAG: phosphomannomutase/phosphoglucomutase [Deltaproteobacteria bacterium]|nr:phosphomannomutase/phosphoglucomutase [Deltaproteobacteria bacterium]